MSSPINLIGDPISDDAINQIVARAALQSSINQSDISVNYKGKAHNAYVKLTSFVKIKDSEGGKQLAAAVHDEGTELARKWSLFNGVNTGNGHDYNFSLDSNKLQGYGQGGVNELGVRPMPGIISVNVSPAGIAGSVRRATVKFRCHNLEQLNIMDILYFRFGFSMLLEWGHTMYATNTQDVTIGRTPIDIFGKEWTKEELHRELAKRRKESFGNYDGMVGLVTNYEWSLTPDGSYDCTLFLTGIGGVIESLKINGTDSIPTINYIKPLPAKGPITTDVSVGAMLAASQVTTNNYDSAIAAAMTAFKTKILQAGMTTAAFRQVVASIFSSGLDLANKPDSIDGYKKGFNAGHMSGDAKVDDFDLNKIYTYHFQSFKGADGKNVDMAYIPLGLLLAYLNNSCIAYEKKGGKSKPLFYIDFNSDTNYCFRVPDQFSVDPGVCLIDNIDNKNEGYLKWLKTRGVDTSAMKPGVPSSEFTKVQNSILERVVSGDLQKYQDSIESRAKMMNILVNIDYILETVLSISTGDSENNAANLSQFLDRLMQGIARVTGNVNNFKVTFDDESNCVRIYDQQLVFNEKSGYPTLPVFGLSSVVRSMSFKTETSTKIGSMLAITAMAAERNPSTDGTDGSAFSALNSRLTDRLLELRERNASEKEGISINERASLFASFRYQMYQMLNYKKEDVENNINFYIECMNTMKNNIDHKAYGTSEIVPDHVTARGILPLSVNLVIDGISNIKTREGFTLPADRLPAQYKNGSLVRVGFVIADLTHTIEGQSWVTTIRGQMVNIPSQETKASGKFTGGSGVRELEGTLSATGKVDTSKYVKDVYVPALEKVFPTYSKGIKLLMTAQTQLEGFYPGSKSYRTNNPGNVYPSNNKGGFATLEQGIKAQWDYILGPTFAGTSKYYKSNMSLYQYLSVYAPYSDGNNPAAYAMFIINYFNKQGVSITSDTTLNQIKAIK